MRSYISIILLIVLTSCSFVERRTSNRSHDPSHAWKSYVYDQASAYEREAMQELNLAQKPHLSEFEKYKVVQRAKVKQLEESLRSPSEIDQYYRHKAFFKSDNDRINFLELSDIYQRQAWLQKHVEVPIDRQPARVDAAIKRGDLVLNMTREAVIESWGEPNEIQVSGNKVYGNERWIYRDLGEPTASSLEEIRYLYFENHVLVGWKTQR